MKCDYQRGEEGSFLVIEEEKIEEGFELRMLRKAKPKKLLKRSVLEYDGIFQIRYEISGMQSVEKYYEERAIGQEELLQLLWEIERAKKECHRFLLSENHFFFRPALAYLNFKNDKCSFVYLPEEETDFLEEMMETAEFILEKLNHQDETAVELAYELYERVGEGNFLLRDFVEEVQRKSGKEKSAAESREKLVDIEEDREAYDSGTHLYSEVTDFEMDEAEEENEEEGLFGAILKRISDRKEAKAEKKERKKQEKEKKKEKKKEQKEEKGKEKRRGKEKESQEWKDEIEDSFGLYEETVLPKMEQTEIGDTVWLGTEEKEENKKEEREEKSIGELIPLGEGLEKIILDKDFILIGKAEGYADAVIRENTVSRIHAEILREKDDFYIEDCNSKNGTYIDRELLQPNERRKLEKGMRVSFGKSMFLFR